MLTVLSGPIGCGKTTLCLELAVEAHQAGIPVAGVLTPALVWRGEKVGIRALDLQSGASRTLARCDRDLGGARIGRYSFDDRVQRWMAARCAAALSTESLVFVDEIGPLELTRGEGLARLLPLLPRPRSRSTVVVVRQALLARFVIRVGPVVPCIVAMDARDRESARSALASLLSFGWVRARASPGDRITPDAIQEGSPDRRQERGHEVVNRGAHTSAVGTRSAPRGIRLH
jgi:nucleoside-triphosphatase THEP1